MSKIALDNRLKYGKIFRLSRERMLVSNSPNIKNNRITQGMTNGFHVGAVFLTLLRLASCYFIMNSEAAPLNFNS